ncbi:helix-turn-helix transcriptional regulator [Escherichia coli]
MSVSRCSWDVAGSMRGLVKINNFLIVYAHNCTIKIISCENEITIGKGKFALLEKHLCVMLQIDKYSKDIPYEFIELGKDDVEQVLKIMDPMYNVNSIGVENLLKLEDKISVVKGGSIASSLFYRIRDKDSDERLRIYDIACLISMSDDPDKAYTSLLRSSKEYFCDIVRRLIERNTEKKWKLSHLSYEMSLSEVAIRKKLDSENTNFYKILLDVRMQKAARLILRDGTQISKISKIVGLSSASYFTKLFRLYHGVTPKKYSMYHKRVSFETSFVKK